MLHAAAVPWIRNGCLGFGHCIVLELSAVEVFFVPIELGELQHAVGNNIAHDIGNLPRRLVAQDHNPDAVGGEEGSRGDETVDRTAMFHAVVPAIVQQAPAKAVVAATDVGVGRVGDTGGIRRLR